MKEGALQVGVVGLGVGRAHALAYLAHGACRLRWLCDRELERARGLARELGQGRATARWRDILEDEEVDIISIASFDQDHGRQVEAALAAGKHVFVEKPLCRSRARLRRICGLWRAAGGRLKLASNLVLRAAPLYAWLREQVAGGRMGELYSLEGEYLYGRLEKLTGGWRGEDRSYSVLLGGGIHMLDLMLWISGRRPRRVWALGNGICSRNSGFRGCDFVTATLEFDSGMLGRLTANFGCVQPHQHLLRLYGTGGSFVYDDRGPRLFSSRDPALGPSFVDLPALVADKGALVPGFVAEVLAGRERPEETQQLFDLIAVLLACDQALAEGGPREVEYL